MKQLSLVLLVSSFWLSTASAQSKRLNHYVDSTYAVWRNVKLEPETRLAALREYCKITISDQYIDSVKYYSEMMYDTATYYNSNRYKGFAINFKAMYYNGWLKFDSAHLFRDSAYNIFRSINDTMGMLVALQNLITGNQKDTARWLYYERIFHFTKGSEKPEIKAIYYKSLSNLVHSKGNSKMALEYALKALNIGRAHIPEDRFIQQHLNIAQLYSKLNNYGKALYHHTLALRDKNMEFQPLAKVRVLVNIGNIYLQLDKFELANQYFSKAKKISIELNNETFLAYNLIVGATCLLELDSVKKASEYGKQALVIAEKTQQPGAIGQVLDLMADVQLKKGNLDSAIYLYKKGIDLYNSQSMFSSAFLGHKLAYAYFQKKQYDSTIHWAEKFFNDKAHLPLMSSMLIASYEKRLHNTLYKTYETLENDAKALKHLKAYKRISDSLQNLTALYNLSLFDFKESTYRDSLEREEKRKIKDAQHEADIEKEKRQKLILFFAGIVLVLLLAVVFGRMRFVRKAKDRIEQEKQIAEKERQRSDELLLNILPAQVAEELKNTGQAKAKKIEQASVLFTDFKHFTQMAEGLEADELVQQINVYFKSFDNICEKYGIEKIKTIGDSYMAASGLSRSSKEEVQGLKDATNLVRAALEMQEFITLNFKPGTLNFQMRAGIHTGPVVAGIVGVKKFQYDIWGDTVNTASRMESHGEVGKVNISEATYNILCHSGLDPESADFTFEAREELEIKGKGLMKTYFVSIAN